jgi:hypothetical protein
MTERREGGNKLLGCLGARRFFVQLSNLVFQKDFSFMKVVFQCGQFP